LPCGVLLKLKKAAATLAHRCGLKPRTTSEVSVMAKSKDNRADARAAREEPELSKELEDAHKRMGFVPFGGAVIPHADGRLELLTFQYTDEQWAEIEKELLDLRPDLSKTGLEQVRRRLRGIASEYLMYSKKRPGAAGRRKLSKRRRARIDKLSKDLLQLLSVELNHPGDDYESPLDLAVFYYDAYDDVLFRLKDLLKPSVEELTGDRADRRDERTWFQFLVLKVWTDLGGRLTRTYDPQFGKISGPLLDYFFAAVRPVMGDDAPSPQSVPAIIDRQEELDRVNQKERAKALERLKLGAETARLPWRVQILPKPTP
jgi:hypothetical protein